MADYPMLPVARHLHKEKCSVKKVLAILIAVVCIINIYSSLLSDNFTSPHEYLRQKLTAGSRPNVANVVTNFSSALSKDAEFDHEFVVNKLNNLKAAVDVDYPEYNVTVRDEVRRVPLWLRRLNKKAKVSNITNDHSGLSHDANHYFLTELLQVRIYDKDKSRWTIHELKQWMHYMLLAGVEHIFICDHFKHDSERLDHALQKYIDSGLVTYLAWNAVSGDPMWAQLRCYQHLTVRYRQSHKWQIAVDMDEYPFAPHDTKENFLVRYLERLPGSVSEVSLQNFLMLDEGDRSRSKMVVDRVVRMTKIPANSLVKPVYRPQRVKRAGIHRNLLDFGKRDNARPEELRMLHYWGASRFEHDDDRLRTLANTVEMSAMRDAWSEQIENSLIVFGEFDAFSNATGP